MYEQIIFTYIYLLVHFLNLYVYKLSSNFEPLISLIARSNVRKVGNLIFLLKCQVFFADIHRYNHSIYILEQ